MPTDFTARHLWSSDKGDGLFAAYPHDRSALASVPYDRNLKVTVSMPRNRGRHDKYFALCQFCADHSSYSKEEVDQLLRIRAGHCTVARLRDGTIAHLPRRLNWGAMDETEFVRFLDRVVQVITTDILPGIAIQAVHDELAGMLERRTG